MKFNTLKGRELDRAVARSVFGLKVGYAPYAWDLKDWDSASAPTETNCQAILNVDYAYGTDMPPALVVPNYSSDLSLAWQVVSEIGKASWLVKQTFSDTLRHLVSPDHDSGVLLSWPNLIFFVDPESICRAALAAVAREFQKDIDSLTTI